jgi:tetratricopeptide (TPR) repeat protein
MMNLEDGFKQVIGMLENLYVKSGIEDMMLATMQLKALEAYKQGNIEQAITYFEECLGTHGIYGLSASAKVRANCANHLSVIYDMEGKEAQQLYYLIYAAETDANIMYQKNLAAYYFNKAMKCVSMNTNDDLILEAANSDCTAMCTVVIGLLDKATSKYVEMAGGLDLSTKVDELGSEL